MSAHMEPVLLHHQNNRNFLYSHDICLFWHYLLWHFYELDNKSVPLSYTVRFRQCFPDNVPESLLYQFLDCHQHLRNQLFSIRLQRKQNTAPYILSMQADTLLRNLRKDSLYFSLRKIHFRFRLFFYSWQILFAAFPTAYLTHLPDSKKTWHFRFRLYTVWYTAPDRIHNTRFLPQLQNLRFREFEKVYLWMFHLRFLQYLASLQERPVRKYWSGAMLQLPVLRLQLLQCRIVVFFYVWFSFETISSLSIYL